MPKALTLNREQIIDTMRFLGYSIHDQNHNLYEDVALTAFTLAGKVVESPVLGQQIAHEVARQRQEIAARLQVIHPDA